MQSIRRFTGLLMTKRLHVWTAPDWDLFAAHRLDRLAQPLLAAALDGIRLVPSSQPTRSRLGGVPDLDDRPWPLHNGAPLAFVAQLDLGELGDRVANTGFPTEGLLSFFYTPEWDAPGYDPASKSGWQVYRITSETTARHIPGTMSSLGYFEPVNVDFKRCATLPSPRSNALDDLGLADDEHKRYEDLWWEVAGNEPHHWIGGHPDIIQNDDVYETCQLAANGVFAGDSSAYESDEGRALLGNATHWRLLFQVWNDDRVRMLWADSGCVYFCIPREDLAAREFDRVWAVMESL